MPKLLETNINLVEKKVNKYNKLSLKKKTVQIREILKKNIKYCKKQINKIEQTFNTQKKKKKLLSFDKIKKRMDKIISYDITIIPIEEKISIYNELKALLEMSDKFITQNKIKEIHVIEDAG